MQRLLQTATHERSSGVGAVSVLFGVFAALAVVYAALLAAGRIPFTSAAWLVSGDMARMGPAALLVFAAVHAFAAWGLFRFRRWGRWLALALLGWGFVQEIPTISMAAADGRILAILRSGTMIIVRVAIAWFLSQEDVRESFTH